MSARAEVMLVLSTVFKVRGGIPRFNQMLGLALDELAPQLGLSVRLLSQDDTWEDYRASGTAWQHVTFIPGGGKFRIVGRTLRECLARRPDLMLVGLLGMTPLGVLALPLLRGGFGFVAHGFECWDGHPLADTRRSRRAAARRSRFVLSVSEYTRAQLVQALGIPRSRVRLLPNTLEPRFERAEALPAAADEGLELLCVSRLWAEERMKGVDHTLEAWARLAPHHPGARLTIVGRGSDKPRLLALAARLDLGSRVRFEQDLTDDELAARYARCAAFVLPSGQEGFGIVFLEAMRFGKPCLGGLAGGTPEVIADGQTGLLVPYGDVNALEAALGRLLDEPELRRRLGEAGRRRLDAEFSFDRFRERLAGHLDELLATRS